MIPNPPIPTPIHIFVYNTGSFTIGSPLRSGHTAMYNFFGKPEPRATSIDNWIAATNQKVIVLRHPVERMNSSFEIYEMNMKPVIDVMDPLPYGQRQQAAIDFINSTDDIESVGLVDTPLMNLFFPEDPGKLEEAKSFFIYRHHSQVYMHMIKDLDFKYINFEELNQYIPMNGMITNTTDRSYDKFQENPHYTLEQLQQEEANYNWILQNKPKLTVAEWQALTT